MRCNSENQRTGGVLLYIDENIKYEILGIQSCARNWWSVIVRINDINYKGILMVVYHSPSGSDAKFVKDLEDSCDSILLSDRVIIMGDFNIDMRVDSYVRNNLVRVMNSMGLKQLVNKATRITEYSETIIDLVFSN